MSSICITCDTESVTTIKSRSTSQALTIVRQLGVNIDLKPISSLGMNNLI